MTKFKASILFMAVLVVALATFILYFSNPPSYSVMQELRNEGNLLVSKIEENRKSNNRYPAILSQAGTALNDRYGGWKYKLENNGKTFVLSIGEYDKYLFELYWDSGRKEWFLDR